MAIGACFGAMNTMYAAVVGADARDRDAPRARLLAPLGPAVVRPRVDLSSRSSAGSSAASSACLAVKLALSGVTGTTNFATFSEVVFAFRLTPALLVTGIVFSLVMGFFGGLFPAGRAAFTKITNALRQVG